ncbi:sulfotransferase family 2 domain-containing protein [Pseudooceanicola onchidii]|uniref:sulfotransferase family 2 domain-containing protein n=1 Tax=Pseudooceanicola onchidii TaxID=2562279 RepID=UPI0010AA8E90|nr:sulfotransferase family 2 domain-containing protein [Pseudooceanicola onchidii]
MPQFDYFVVFAEMRTGSNFLEANLNAFPGLACVGEAFNPHFPGYPNKSDCLGITLDQREADPHALIDAVRAQDSLTGFRFFHDHDPRVLDPILTDPRCGKIILTRNPVDSYVSWKIAQDTGQWKLTDVRRRKDTAAVAFDADEFEAHMQQLQDFQVRLLNAMQVTGQTPFYVAYEDLQDVAVMNGLARWLGQVDQLDRLDDKLKRQNPAPISEKVADFDGMQQALARLDRFNLNRTPNFEPRRGPNVPSYQAAAKTPLLYMPVRAEIDRQVSDWLAGLDGVDKSDLPGKFTQKTLRQWMRRNPGFRSFAVIRHPVARAHSVFCNRIVKTGRGAYGEIRQTLRQKYKLPIPGRNGDDPYPVEDHRDAFKLFLDFVKANLSGQTSIRIDQSWATQASVIEGMSAFCLPDMILREDELSDALPALARKVGHPDPARPRAAPEDQPHTLASIYDAEIEQKAADAYQRDYLLFGFKGWA